MERELWPLLYRTVREVAGEFHQKYVRIPGWILLLTMLWAALHDRPVGWACKETNWKTTRLRPPKLPSPSTISRRIDRVAIGLLWRAVEQRLRDQGAPPSLMSFLDGKSLPDAQRIRKLVMDGVQARWQKAMNFMQFGRPKRGKKRLSTPRKPQLLDVCCLS